MLVQRAVYGNRLPESNLKQSATRPSWHVAVLPIKIDHPYAWKDQSVEEESG